MESRRGALFYGGNKLSVDGGGEHVLRFFLWFFRGSFSPFFLPGKWRCSDHFSGHCDTKCSIETRRSIGGGRGKSTRERERERVALRKNGGPRFKERPS